MPKTPLTTKISAQSLIGHVARVKRGVSASLRVRYSSAGSFTVCLAAALGLNAVAVSVFAAIAPHWQGSVGGADRTHWITAIATQTATTTAPTNEDRPAVVSKVRPTAQPKATRVEDTTLPAQSLQSPHAGDADQSEPVRFYGFEEVDQPAEPAPDSDWNLDPALLDALGVQILIFDIFISRTGEVIGCSIIEPESLNDDARVALETRLTRNVLKPAIRHETSVASVRRIEISVGSPDL